MTKSELYGFAIWAASKIEEESDKIDKRADAMDDPFDRILNAGKSSGMLSAAMLLTELAEQWNDV